MKKWSTRAALSTFGVLVALIVAEALLRMTRVPWPLDLWNYMASCYENDAPSPIVYVDARLGVRVARPHVETRCGFNRRYWRHRSDLLGARDPEDWARVDVALLGDSMVYGHGVEEPDTVAHVLAARLGRRVANFGIFGASPVEYLWQVENVVPRVHPRVVVVFLYRNDFGEVLAARSPERIRAFVETGESTETEAVLPDHLFDDDERRPSSIAQAASHLFVYRAARFYWLRRSRRSAKSPPSKTPKGHDNDLAVQYIRTAAKMMKATVEASGSRLVIAYMPTDALPGSGGERMGKLMRKVAANLTTALGIPYFDPTSSLTLADGRPDPDAYLDGDWHLSPAGHRRLAEALDAFLRQRRMLD